MTLAEDAVSFGIFPVFGDLAKSFAEVPSTGVGPCCERGESGLL